MKNSLIYLAPMLAGALFPLVTLPIFTRLLTREEYGAWALAVVYGSFASGVANFGLVDAYQRNFFQHPTPRERSTLLYTTLAFVLTALGAFGVLTWLFRARLAHAIIGTAEYGGLLFWAFCGTGLASVKAYYLIYLRSMDDAVAYVKYTLDENVLNVLFSLFLVAYLRVGVMGLVVGQLLASSLVLSILMAKFLKRQRLAFDLPLLGQSLKLSYPLTPRILLGVVGTQLDKYVVGLLGTIGGVGVYTIGQKLAYMAFNFSTALENVFVPHVYARMFEREKIGHDTVGGYITPFVYLAFGGALAIALFAEEALDILTPASYHGAIAVVQVLVLNYAIAFFGKLPQLMYAKKAHIISVLSTVTIAFNSACIIVGVHWFGTVGAAWGSLTGGVVGSALFVFYGQRYYAIAWQYARVGSIVALVFAASFTMLAVDALGLPYSMRFAAKLVFAAVYVFLGVRLRVLTRERFALITNGIRTRLRPTAAPGPVISVPPDATASSSDPTVAPAQSALRTPDPLGKSLAP
jgi:O-antigen/teichoic acid export membrane protein